VKGDDGYGEGEDGDDERKRVVFPSGIRAGLSLTMLSWLGLRERVAVFAEVGRWQRSEG
jgi:hypothetical protein